MAYFQFGDKQLKLNPGAQRLGPDGTEADIRLPSGDATATAIVVLNPDQTVIIRKADDASVVLVNKVPLGAEPEVLMHGDHVEIGGNDLRFGDAAKAGSTQFISAADLAEIARARADLAPNRPTFATGGRLISLVDGREYLVPEKGIVMGRDPAVDVVVANTQVSRRHVQITAGENGYVLTDLSTNGVWVNDARVVQKQVLGKGDIIKVGEEEFRFYADVREPTIPPTTPPANTAFTEEAAAQPDAPVADEHRTETPPAVAALTPADAGSVSVAPAPAPAAPAPAAPAPVAPASPARPVLATLTVTGDGVDKGKRFDVIGPLTNIGRGAHNDFVLESESVSDSHAKLQKREGGWVLVDVGSTNGTFLGGRRLSGEQAVKGAPDLRFGDVRVLFRPGEEKVEEGKSTRVIPLSVAEEARKAAAARRTAEPVTKPRTPPSAPIIIPEPVPEKTGSPGSPLQGWMLILLLLSAVVAYFIFGRTP